MAVLLPPWCCRERRANGRVLAALWCCIEERRTRWPCCRRRWCCYRRAIANGRVAVPAVLLRSVGSGGGVCRRGVARKREPMAVFECLHERESPVAVLSRRWCSLSASAPMAVLKLPVVLFLSAAAPIPVRWLPVVFMKRTRKPMARLKLALLLVSASAPMAMLKSPVVLLSSAPEPTATLYWPVVS